MVNGVRTAAVGGVGTGLERDVLAHDDFRFLVIQGQQAGGGKQVAAGIARQRRYQCTEPIAAQPQDRAFRGFIQFIEVHCADDRDVGSRKIDEALGAAAVEAPLHPHRFGDVAGNLDDGCMDKHLGPGLVQFTHDVFDGAHLGRFGDQHQGILAFIGHDHEGAGGGAVSQPGEGRCGFFILPDAFQHLGQLLGIAVAQADDPRVVLGSDGRNVEGPGQIHQALTHGRCADDHQAIAPGVSDHQACRITLALATGGFHERRDIAGLGMAQSHHHMIAVAPRIQLLHHPGDALHIGGGVGDYHSVGRYRGADVTIGRHQGPHQSGDIGGNARLQIEDPGNELRRRGAFGIVTGARPGIADRGDQDPLAFVDHREVVCIEHRIEQPTYTFAVQCLAGHDGNAPRHAGIKHHGLAQNRRELLDHVAQIRIVHCQLPLGLLGP